MDRIRGRHFNLQSLVPVRDVVPGRARPHYNLAVARLQKAAGRARTAD